MLRYMGRETEMCFVSQTAPRKWKVCRPEVGAREWGHCGVMETREGGHVRDDKFDSIDTEENGGQATLLCRKISDVSLCCLSCCCRVAAHIANITLQTISPIANLHVKVWQITQSLRFHSFPQFRESIPITVSEMWFHKKLEECSI